MLTFTSRPALFSTTWPFCSLREMLCVTLCMIVFTWGLRLFINTQEAGYAWARGLGRILSLLYSLASLGMLVLALGSRTPRDHAQSISHMWCYQQDSYPLVFYLFYLSKIYEMSDIAVVTLQKPPIHWHFLVHHVSTFSLVWVAAYCGLDLLPIVVANTAHHVLMYAYFGGIGWLGPLLGMTGVAQLLLGLLLCVRNLVVRAQGTPCDGHAIGELYILTLYIVYFGFQVNDLRGRGQKKTKTS